MKSLNTLSIRVRISLLAGICMAGAVSILLGTSLYQGHQQKLHVETAARKLLADDASQLLLSVTAEQAQAVRQMFASKASAAGQLSDFLSGMKTSHHDLELPIGVARSIAINTQQVMFRKENELLGLWSVFEPQALDQQDLLFIGDARRGSNEQGRFGSYWSRYTGTDVHTAISEADLAKTAKNSVGDAGNWWYRCPLELSKPCLLEPYKDSINGHSRLMTTISLPISVAGKAIGAVGADISLETLQKSVDLASQSLFGGEAKVSIISSSGAIAASSGNPQWLGMFAKSAMRAAGPEDNIIAIPSAPAVHKHGTTLVSEYPVSPIPDIAPWKVRIELPLEVALARATALDATLTDVQSRAAWINLLVGAITSLVGIASIALTAAGVTRPIRRVSQGLTDIAKGDGDLTQRLNHSRNDELGALVSGFNDLMDRLQPAVAQVKISVTESRSIATESSNIAQQTDQGMQLQLREVEQVATAAHEMSMTSNEVANNAASAANAAEDADNATRIGMRTVTRSSDRITKMAETVSAAVADVERLSASNEQIVTVVEVIRSIADQTNLLALNAAIEAARAGENGRGFAVVADEVRSLARRTQNSVGEIQQVIERIQIATTEVVQSMQGSHRMAEANVTDSQETSAALSRINQAVEVIRDMNTQIASAAGQQSVVAEAISRNVSAIRSFTELLGNQAAQSARASRNLDLLSGKQADLMDQFRV